MPGSLFREWKVALAFVGGIAVLAGAFVSENGEHRLFTELRPRAQSDTSDHAPPAPPVTPIPSRAVSGQDLQQGQFAPDDEAEDQFAEPDDVAELPGLAGLPVGPAPGAEPAAENAEAADDVQAAVPPNPAQSLP